MRVAPLALALSLLAACASSEENASMNVTAHTIYNSRYCQGLNREAGVGLISAGQWRDLLSRQQDKAIPTTAAQVRGRLVLIDMGEQRTAGYGIRLAPTGVRLVGDILNISVIWETPKAGMMQAQVITHPCLVLDVEANGFRTIQVMDQGQGVRLESQPVSTQ